MVTGYIEGLRLGKDDLERDKELAYERERRGITDKRTDDAFNVLSQQYGAVAGDPQRAAQLQDQAWQGQDRKTAQTDKAKADADAAQLRGLLILKTARDKGLDMGKAVTALGPGGLKAFGTDLPGMLGFVKQITDDPAMLDAKIAGLTGQTPDAGGKKIFKQEFVVGPNGQKGTLLTFQDGTTQFVSEYQQMPSSSSGPGPKVINGQLVAPDGTILGDYTGAALSQAANTAVGTGIGKSQADALTSLPAARQSVQKSTDAIAAVINDPNLDAILGSPSFTGMLQKGGLGGLTQFFGDFGVVPGSPAAEAAAKLEFIGSQSFLQGIQALKGFGPVTEREGAAAQQAVANLSRLRDPAAIRGELQRLASSLQAYYAALEQEAAGGFTGIQAPGVAAPRLPPGGAAPDPQSTTPAPKVSAKYY